MSRPHGLSARTQAPSGSVGPEAEAALLTVRGLTMHYPVSRRGLLPHRAGVLHAVEDVDLTVRSGEVLGLVGESGCGKSTLGKCIVGSQRPTSGEVWLRTAEGGRVDLASLGRRELRDQQRDVRVVFQDPYSCLNSRMTVGQIIGDPLKVHKIASGSELEARVAESMRRVGLAPELMKRYPHAFSGGQRQRINIARALITGPRLVVADEAVSALDVSVRAQIINLLKDLQDEHDLTYLFISHDLSVIEGLCDRVAVMYLGRIVEVADTDELFDSPRHPYTEALLSAVPRPDPRLRGAGRRIRLSDEFPDPAHPPPGCAFHTRCGYALPVCSAGLPPLELTAHGHRVACVRTKDLALAGVAGGDRSTAATLPGGSE